MREKYAIMAKNIALLIGATVFAIFIFSLIWHLKKSDETELLGCGTKSPVLSESGNALIGKTLFVNNCASCHNKNMKDQLTGPALHDWRNYLKDEKEMLSYLNNPKSYIKKHRLFRKKLIQYEAIESMAFPNLTQNDVNAIIEYIDSRCQIVPH